jgi:hypothetical protein
MLLPNRFLIPRTDNNGANSVILLIHSHKVLHRLAVQE